MQWFHRGISRIGFKTPHHLIKPLDPGGGRKTPAKWHGTGACQPGTGWTPRPAHTCAHHQCAPHGWAHVCSTPPPHPHQVGKPRFHAISPGFSTTRIQAIFDRDTRYLGTSSVTWNTTVRIPWYTTLVARVLFWFQLRPAAFWDAERLLAAGGMYMPLFEKLAQKHKIKVGYLCNNGNTGKFHVLLGIGLVASRSNILKYY